jgi:adenosylcobyric acid synthase
VEALGFIDDEIVFGKEKILKRHKERYEIHHGTSARYPDAYRSKNLYGTFSHGLFVDAWFRQYEAERITAFVEKMRPCLHIERIMAQLS